MVLPTVASQHDDPIPVPDQAVPIIRIEHLVKRYAGMDFNAVDGLDLAVMPGAGITAQNIAALATVTGAHEFHASAKRQLPSGMRHRQARMPDMEEGELRSDIEQVRALAAALQTQSHQHP